MHGCIMKVNHVTGCGIHTCTVLYAFITQSRDLIIINNCFGDACDSAFYTKTCSAGKKHLPPETNQQSFTITYIHHLFFMPLQLFFRTKLSLFKCFFHV